MLLLLLLMLERGEEGGVPVAGEWVGALMGGVVEEEGEMGHPTSGQQQ